MHTIGQIDFAEVKSRVSIEQVIDMLGIEAKPHNGQLRGPCPFCDGKAPRAFVATPKLGLWNSFCPDCKGGGDVISLVARAHKISPLEAAKALANHFRLTGEKQPPRPEPAKAGEELKPLDYLDPAHEAVQALGLSPETAQKFGAGYKPKGILAGRLAIPVYQHGKLLAYCGRAVRKEQEPALAFPKGFDETSVIFNADNVKADTLTITRDPLDVLLASQSGVTNVVALMGGITSNQLDLLAALMRKHEIASAEMY